MRYEKWIKDWKTALAENFFLRVVTLLLLVGLILNATVFRGQDKIILVPPEIDRGIWVQSNKASREYLEQMAVFIATLIGNLSPSNSEFVLRTLEKYIAPSTWSQVKTDIASQALYIKRNNISQAFFTRKIIIDEKERTAKVEGDTIRFIGGVKIAREPMNIHLKFEVDNYKLTVLEFSVETPERRRGGEE